MAKLIAASMYGNQHYVQAVEIDINKPVPISWYWVKSPLLATKFVDERIVDICLTRVKSYYANSVLADYDVEVHNWSLGANKWITTLTSTIET